MTYHGKVRNGVVTLPPETRLPEGADVHVEIVESSAAAGEDDPAFSIAELAVDTGVPDLSVNLDHYLYGHPKVGAHG